MSHFEKPKTFLGLPLHLFFISMAAFMVCGLIYARLWFSAPISTNDTQGYLLVADDLRDGRLDTLFNRTPGYPMLLLISGSQEAPNRNLFHIQLALHFLSIYLGLVLLHQLQVRQRWLLVFLGICLLPMYSEKAAYALTENFTQFLLVAGLVGLVLWLESNKWSWLLLSGFALAISGITRPTYQVLGLGIALLMGLLIMLPSLRIYRMRILTASGVLAFFSLMIVGGLILYNSRNFGFAGITPLSGFNLNTKTARVLERLPDEYSIVREILIRQRNIALLKPHSSHTGAQYVLDAENHTFEDLQKATGMDTIELSNYMLKLNLLLIRSAPLEYLTDVGYAFVTYWFPANGQVSNMDSRIWQTIWTLIHFIGLALFIGQLMLLVGFAVLLLSLPAGDRIKLTGNIPKLRMRLELFLYGYVIILVTVVISTFMQSGEARYRVPSDMIILLVTFAGLDMLFHVRRAFQARLSV